MARPTALQLNVDASFESYGENSEGVSITGTGITSTIAGSIITNGPDSEGVSIQALDTTDPESKLTALISAQITTRANGSEGVSLAANKATLNITGDISTSGRRVTCGVIGSRPSPPPPSPNPLAGAHARSSRFLILALGSLASTPRPPPLAPQGC